MSLTVSYNRLWKLLVDKKMSKADLRRAAEISPNTMTKLRRDEEVSMTVLKRICEYLECNIGDICDFIPASKSEVNSWMTEQLLLECEQFIRNGGILPLHPLGG